EAIGHLHAVGKTAHVDLRRRRALAGMETFGRKNDAELTVLPLDDIAFANRACDDSHVFIPRIGARGAAAATLLSSLGLRECGAHHTHFAAKGQIGSNRPSPLLPARMRRP